MATASGLQVNFTDLKMLGWPIHLKALQCMQKIREKFDRQYTWIDEALIEAKKTFASPEIHMIPKTPSAKKSRRVIQQVIEEEDDDFENEQPKKRTRVAKGKARGGKKTAGNTSQETGVSSEASVDTEYETSASESTTRSLRTRNSRKPTSTRSTRNTRQKKQETSEEETEEIPSQPHVPVLSLELALVEAQSKRKTRSDGPKSSIGPRLDCVEPSSVREGMELPAVVNVENNDATERSETEMEVSSPDQIRPCIVISDSDENKTPVVKPRRSSRQSKEVVRSESQKNDTASPTTVKSSTQVHESCSPNKNDSAKKKPFYLLNVKEKANKYEELVRKSGGSREASPVARVTPQSQRICSKGATVVKTVTPCTPQSKRKITPGTPSTYVSKQTLTIKKTVPSNLGASPAHTTIKVQSVEKQKKGDGRRKSSCRVSGSKLSLSRRRSSIQRHKERRSSGKPIIAVLPQLQEVKARLNNTACSSSGDETPEPSKQSTRSKLRLNKNGAQTTAAEPITTSASGSDEHMDSNDSTTPPRRTTRSKMRQNKPAPPALPLASDSDEGTPDAGYMNIKPPSTMAPIRSTRSKMRKLEQLESTSSPSVKKMGLVRNDSAKRPAKHSDDNNTPQKKRHIDTSPDNGNDTVSRTPPRVYTPSHAQSFLHNLKKSKIMTPSNLNTTVTSFLARNTPSKKPTTKEIVEQKRKQLLAKERQEEDRLAKRQEYLQKKAEDQRKKRENRQLLAAKRREEQLRKETEAKKGLTQKLEEKKALTAKLQEEKQREEREKQKQRDKRLAEAEQRRKQEEDLRQQKLIEMEQEQQRMKELQQRKKEYEEQERLKRIAEQRRAQEERLAEIERERQREVEKLRQQEEQRQREEQQQRKEREEREKREKAERDRQELERQRERQRQREKELEKQREMERQRVLEEKRGQEEQRRVQEEERRIQKLIKSHNNTLQSNTSLNQQGPTVPVPATTKQPPSKPALNTTVNMDTSTSSQLNTTYNKDHNASHSDENTESYKITPVRKVYKPPTNENYNIHDLKSDDSTDDEEQPRKKIPAWATGPQLKAAIINQYYKPPDLDKIFPIIEAPDLCKLFAKKKAKFFKRTSSAVWHTPIYMPSGKPLQQ